MAQGLDKCQKCGSSRTLSTETHVHCRACGATEPIRK
jgi:DNA-directed RNA polymerase subunit RPC12/RpoP